MIFPRAISGHRNLVSPSNYTPNQVTVDREGLTFDAQDRMVSLQVLGSGGASKRVRIKIIGSWGTRIGIVPQGYGPRPNRLRTLPRTKGRGYGPYHKARAHGPMGLGPCPEQVFCYFFFITCKLNKQGEIYIYIYIYILDNLIGRGVQKFKPLMS